MARSARKKRQKKHRKTNGTNKKASLEIEALEPRILLSATWVDSDTSEANEGATEGNDTFTGTDVADVADALGGDDTMSGGDGDDNLFGGAGDDLIQGDAGNDTLDGGADDDILSGGDGDDTLGGGSGSDTLSGGAGDDMLDGDGGVDTASYADAESAVNVNLVTGTATGEGNDTLTNIENVTGSDHDDTLTGDAIGNVLDGGAGDDTIAGGGGNDQLQGGAGIDALDGGEGNDTLSGGSGDDTLDGGTGDDTLDGGDDVDTASYADADSAVNVNLATGTATGDGNDTLSNIENVTGSDHDDTLTGDAAANVLDGGAGDDTLSGGAGDDHLLGGDGDDNLTGGAGVDTLEGGAGADTLDGGEGSDVLSGGDGDDTLGGAGGDNVLDGGAGNDTLITGAGADTLIGGDGDDSLTAGAGDDTLQGGAGADTLDGGEGNDVLSGGDGDDVLTGGVGDDVLSGGAGDDVIDGGDGTDTADYSDAVNGVTVDLTLDGQAQDTGDGIDTLTGIESVIGSEHDDTFIFSNPVNGAVYDVDGNAGTNRIEVVGFNIDDATVDRDAGTVAVNVGGLSFTVNYRNIHSASFDDAEIFLDNEAPVADAGLDQAVTEDDLITLDASNSFDADAGDALTYQWTQTSGPTVELSDANAAQPTFTPPDVSEPTTLTFEVAVSDGEATQTDSVEITVNPVNHGPTADAGADQTVTEDEVVTLNASASSDPDAEDTLTYSWTQTGGPAVDLSDATASQPTFTPPNVSEPTTLTFEVEVSDGESTHTDTVEITVDPVADVDPHIAYVQSLDYGDFKDLPPEDIPYLTTDQIASIPSAYSFNQWSDAAQAALTTEQVQALDVGNVGIGQLTEAQRADLTVEQIQDVTTNDLRYVLAEDVPDLTTDQIASIPSAYSFNQWSDDAQAALTTEQVQALDVGNVGIGQLTEAQRADLTVEQIQDVTTNDLRYVLAEDVPDLTTDQIASIPSAYSFNQWSAEARAALTTDQVQALDVGSVGIGKLTEAQRADLTVEQIQDVTTNDLRYVLAEDVPDLTTDQIASIPSAYSFNQWSDAAQAALTTDQVQALDVGSVGLSQLTEAQRGDLTVEQIQSLSVNDFRYVLAEDIPDLTTEQIASIPSAYSFNQLSTEARAALTTEQVQALEVGNVGISKLTEAQRADLTVEQIQSLSVNDFRYVLPEDVPSLTVDQIASIPSTYSFNQWSEDARAALTPEQIQALPEHLSGYTFVGGAGDDVLVGNANVNNMMGLDGDDTISGGAGNDVLDGGDGADVLDGGGGRDTLLGGSGDDTFAFANAADGDTYTVDGGADNDTLDLSAFHPDDIAIDNGQITVDLGNGQSFSIAFQNVEQIRTSTGVISAENAAPVADAGADQVVAEDVLVTLNAGNSSDADGDDLSYTWTQTSGPAVQLSDANAAEPTFTSPDVTEPTTLIFEVAVSDGATAQTDTVQITVNPSPAPGGQAVSVPVPEVDSTKSVPDGDNDAPVKGDPVADVAEPAAADPAVPEPVNAGQGPAAVDVAPVPPADVPASPVVEAPPADPATGPDSPIDAASVSGQADLSPSVTDGGTENDPAIPAVSVETAAAGGAATSAGRGDAGTGMAANNWDGTEDLQVLDPRQDIAGALEVEEAGASTQAAGPDSPDLFAMIAGPQYGEGAQGVGHMLHPSETSELRRDEIDAFGGEQLEVPAGAAEMSFHEAFVEAEANADDRPGQSGHSDGPDTAPDAGGERNASDGAHRHVEPSVTDQAFAEAGPSRGFLATLWALIRGAGDTRTGDTMVADSKKTGGRRR